MYTRSSGFWLGYERVLNCRAKKLGPITVVIVVINDGSRLWNSCEKHERLLSKRNEAYEEGGLLFCALFNKLKNFE